MAHQPLTRRRTAYHMPNVTEPSFPRVAALKTADAFRATSTSERHHLRSTTRSRRRRRRRSRRRLPSTASRSATGSAILPMEGWDGTTTAKPSDLTSRRWQQFGSERRQADLGRRSRGRPPRRPRQPAQLVLDASERSGRSRISRRRSSASTCERFGPTAADELYVGLQLTHSGRFARPLRTRSGAARRLRASAARRALPATAFAC